MRKFFLLFIAMFIEICCFANRTFAGTGSGPASFALIIGSNRAGEGQGPLRFATQDADRFRTVLREIGGYDEKNVRLLRDPEADEILEAIAGISQNIRTLSEIGDETRFVFYYSGHARAQALNLGKQDLPLEELRTRFQKLPAKTKLIVLDACQAGAISQIKGVERAVDFSHNSVDRLNTEGMAVIASSSASELAQESEELGGSFFTHHLVVGLRGAADANGDGNVTLSEVYQYAYDNTLVATARTAVGKQHVTLETDLKGKGEMVITRPDSAKSWLVLPRALDAEILVHRKSDNAVMAEVHKASGDEVRLALPPATYGSVVRYKTSALLCDTHLAENDTLTLETENCRSVSLERTLDKGTHRRDERIALEVGMGGMFERSDAYTDRLSDFSFYRSEERGDAENPTLHFAIVALFDILRYLQVGLVFSNLDDGQYKWPRDDFSSGESKEFSWKSYRLGAMVRGSWPLLRDYLVPYVQLDLGAAFSKTFFKNETVYEEHEETQWGFQLSGAGGAQFMFSQYVGLFIQGEYIWAPAMENLFGDKHDTGGFVFVGGVRAGI